MAGYCFRYKNKMIYWPSGAGYPNNFNLIDLIDTSYYKKKSVKVTVKTYKLGIK